MKLMLCGLWIIGYLVASMLKADEFKLDVYLFDNKEGLFFLLFESETVSTVVQTDIKSLKN